MKSNWDCCLVQAKQCSDRSQQGHMSTGGLKDRYGSQERLKVWLINRQGKEDE